MQHTLHMAPHIMKMIKTVLTVLTFTLGLNAAYAQLSRPEYKVVVDNFIDCINNADIDKLDSIVTYPIERPYPMPPIRNKEELKKRYSELFDDYLTSLIVNSNSTQDWSDVGYRGIMLNRGTVWIDYDGKLISTNYISEKEKAVQQEWIDYERGLLHVSLKEFQKPIYTIETAKFIVRIDLLEKRRFRYASWSKGAKLSDEPDLILNNGVKMFEGTGGNHHYKFTNGQYSYVVYANILGSNEQPPFNLEVSRNDKVLLNQAAALKKLK
jgi:hypothetical protein